jgi:hypothetical protein
MMSGHHGFHFLTLPPTRLIQKQLPDSNCCQANLRQFIETKWNLINWQDICHLVYILLGKWQHHAGGFKGQILLSQSVGPIMDNRFHFFILPLSYILPNTLRKYNWNLIKFCEISITQSIIANLLPRHCEHSNLWFQLGINLYQIEIL